MKKEYKKPELLFDSFELSMNIAGTCAAPINHTEKTCEIMPGVKLFLDTNSCAVTPEDPSICYHNPSDTEKLFTS